MKLYIRKGEDAEGIDIKKWAWEHEAYIDAHIDTEDPEELLVWHIEKTRFLQHERLVHFIVTFLTVIGVFFAAGLLVLMPSDADPLFQILLTIMLIGLLILLACYMYHYFVLENTTQHWYRIAEHIHDRVLARQAAESGAGEKPATANVANATDATDAARKPATMNDATTKPARKEATDHD